MKCSDCKRSFKAGFLIDGLCHRCTSMKLHETQQALRVAECALVDLKCQVGELTKQLALQKARADVK